jgi:acetylglutamate kinase
MPKAACIESALKGGVRRVHIINFNEPDTLLLEVFTNEGTGTMVVERTENLSPEERTVEVEARSRN